MGDGGRVFSTPIPPESDAQNHLAESMIDHLTVRPVNLTDADLSAFLDGQYQRILHDYEAEPNTNQ